jgi:hypothetical protein
MTTQELKEYIDKILGNNIRCLLPSYWWKRLFGLVVDKIDETNNKVAKLPTKNYVDNAISELPTKNYVDEVIANVEIDVDSSMSDTSTNPVQNKVVKDYVDTTASEIYQQLANVDELVTIPELFTFQEYYDALIAAGFEDGKSYGKVFMYRDGIGLRVDITTREIYIIWMNVFGDIVQSSIGKYINTTMKDKILNGGILCIGVASSEAEARNKEFLRYSYPNERTRIFYVTSDTGTITTTAVALLYIGYSDYTIKVQNGDIVETWQINKDDGSYTKLGSVEPVDKSEVIANEEVVATALNEINERVNVLTEISSNSATKDELNALQDSVIENEEVTAAALNELLNKVKNLENKIAALENV